MIPTLLAVAARRRRVRSRRDRRLPAEATLTCDRQASLEVALAFDAQSQRRLEVEDDVEQFVALFEESLRRTSMLHKLNTSLIVTLLLNRSLLIVVVHFY